MDFLEHKWVSSKDPKKAYEQKLKEREYNRKYYSQHSDKWKTKYAKVDVYSMRVANTDKFIPHKKLSNTETIKLIESYKNVPDTHSSLSSLGEQNAREIAREQRKKADYRSYNQSVIDKLVDRYDVFSESNRRALKKGVSFVQKYFNTNWEKHQENYNIGLDTILSKFKKKEAIK